MTLRGFLKSCAPIALQEIREARKQFRLVEGVSSSGSWILACSPARRTAIETSRFHLFPKALRRPLSVVIDVGAHKGHWIKSLLDIVPVSEIYIFEPNPKAMGECRRRVGSRPGVIFNEIALGEAPGSAFLHITRSSDFSSLLKPKSSFIDSNYRNHPVQVVVEQEVAISSLDNAMPTGKTIDLLKLDVQGYERQVLAGALTTLRSTKAILLETNFHSHYEGDETFASLYALLTQELGFAFWDISKPYRGDIGNALWADALFVNPYYAI
ncbi:MAG TPA: FkbM family methyltransferase [Candidatus Angelobacter sp.]|jgi:FkbM family methyltransferase